MFEGIRWRITWPFLLLIVGALSALGVLLAQAEQREYVATRRDELLAEARLTARLVAPQLAAAAGQPSPELEELARALSRDAGARVTFVALDGTVLADSERDPRLMENHRDRPEIRAALAAGEGASQRASDTLLTELTYAAAVARTQAGPVGVVRLALEVSRVQAIADQHRQIVMLSSLVTAALAALLAAWVARATARPIHDLTRAVVAMADGDLTRRIPVSSRDEVGTLAFAFNHLADRFGHLLATVDGERQKLALVLAHLTDGVVLFNQNGEVTLANAAAARLIRGATGTRVRAEDLIGRTLMQVARADELDAALRRCLQQHETTTVLFERGLDRRPLRVVFVPLSGDEGGALVVIQDLTEIRRTEAIRRDFVANVSHELRTPLATLKALAETLEDGALDDPEMARHFLAKMHIEVDGLSHLVQELLELSRIESGQEPLRFETVPVDELIERAGARLGVQAERKGLQLVCRTDAGSWAVSCDPGRIEQVLTNLLQNAVKFTPPGGRIEVWAEPADDEQIAIIVRDTGIGIAPDDLPRIFERFYKADRSRTGGGTGLGLAIAKHLVLAHGGRIHAESPGEGRGSTFRITLPVAAPAPAPAATADADRSAVSGLENEGEIASAPRR